MHRSENRIDKWEIEVEMTFADGRQSLGYLFVRPAQRLSDMLNDDRRFLPFRHSDGRVELIAKDSIASAMPLHKDDQSDSIGDPYDFLGVKRIIGDDELRDIYLDLCKQNHPDKLQSLETAPDIVDYANARLRRIIDAYGRIMVERHGKADDISDPGKAAE